MLISICVFYFAGVAGIMASYKWKLTMIHPVYKHYSILMSLKEHVKTKMLYLLYYNRPGLEYNSIYPIGQLVYFQQDYQAKPML